MIPVREIALPGSVAMSSVPTEQIGPNQSVHLGIGFRLLELESHEGCRIQKNNFIRSNVAVNEGKRQQFG